MPAVTDARPWREWYRSERWRQRAKAQINAEPLCAQCLADDKITAASVADHNPPHNGVWNAFRLGPLQSLCAECHARKRGLDLHGYRWDIGDDGLPIDPNHPFNSRRASDGRSAAGKPRERLRPVGPGVPSHPFEVSRA
jgi:5-methylcytosine-specific restriction enzyme A